MIDHKLNELIEVFLMRECFIPKMFNYDYDPHEYKMVIRMTGGKIVKYNQIPKYIDDVFGCGPISNLDLLIIYNKKLDDYGKQE